MATDTTGRPFGFDDYYTRGGETGFGDYGITGRKRKTYDRGFDIDTGNSSSLSLTNRLFGAADPAWLCRSASPGHSLRVRRLWRYRF